ncbi:MAG: T9SS type A sorting domain-containing protein [Cytophagales bacterium]|nr:T9SS type A sorting domain-containing protein [Cytophagales bacterium]MDW8383775.1 T9SS type A sorting domain-containing protein [Flammeovirgaceae bacterium]
MAFNLLNALSLIVETSQFSGLVGPDDVVLTGKPVAQYVFSGNGSEIIVWITGFILSGATSLNYVSEIPKFKVDLKTLLALSENLQRWHLYPNLVADDLYIDIPELIEKVLIIDYQGKLLKESESTPIWIGDLPSGTYFVEVRANNLRKVFRVLKE